MVKNPVIAGAITPTLQVTEWRNGLSFSKKTLPPCFVGNCFVDLTKDDHGDISGPLRLGGFTINHIEISTNLVIVGRPVNPRGCSVLHRS